MSFDGKREAALFIGGGDARDAIFVNSRPRLGRDSDLAPIGKLFSLQTSGFYIFIRAETKLLTCRTKINPN